MNDHIEPGGSDAHDAAHEHDHGALGDAEFAEFMELAAEEGFDLEDVEGAHRGGGPRPASGARRRRPSPTSASRPW
ncbi:hypothetical protein GCM10019016_041190 [Streptomyces prasinosporus]|uniref:Uncharacterized protein n=1 Tax=Streptomyces prasinosporus TaxID=68256 RepID=A0ABP6TQR9_9ACTN